MRTASRLRRHPLGRSIAGLAILAAAITFSTSCTLFRPVDSAADGRPIPGGSSVLELRDPARRPGTPLVMVAMPGSALFQTTRRAFLTEIGEAFDVSTLVVTPETTSDELGAAIRRDQPTCIVLMNNPTVRLYRDYQRARPGEKFPPAVIVMASFLEDIRQGLVGATGIAYEVPGVTAFVSLRATIKAPVTRVGVLHSRYSRDFIERQRRLAAPEHIEIVPVEVDDEQPSVGTVRRALQALESAHHIDALWILNDNRLLKDGRFLLEAWTPALESLGVPVVVGAEPLVNPQSPFGTFAVLPDHAGLGVQAANLILDLADSGWRTDLHPVELPLSTISVLDVTQAETKFGLREDALNHIDRPAR